ncbi:MAG: ribosome maturation factor RimM [Desulfuromonadales bacterium]|nr:ribosome maturation factor RimM [Desulfuromonadales bacterium]
MEAGLVVGTHGLRGDLKVRMTALAAEDLLTAEKIYLQRKDGEAEVFTPLRQTLHKGNVLLRLDGYESLTSVAPLIGAKVLLNEDELPEPDDGQFRFHRLVGLQVVDEQLGPLGRLVDMFTTAAHDTYIVEGGAGEILIPAVPEIITGIDIDGRVMHVDLPDGLVSINQ